MKTPIELINTEIEAKSAAIARMEMDIQLYNIQLAELRRIADILSGAHVKDEVSNRPLIADSNIIIISKAEILSEIKSAGEFILTKSISAGKYDKENKLIRQRISTHLYEMRKRGTIVNYSPNNSNSNTYWGLPEWMGTDNKPKEEYAKNIK